MAAKAYKKYENGDLTGYSERSEETNLPVLVLEDYNEKMLEEDMGQWLTQLEADEADCQNPQDYLAVFSRNISKIATNLAWKTGQDQADYYQQGMRLLYEFLEKNNPNPKDIQNWRKLVNKYIHDGICSYFRRNELKHMLHGQTTDVEREEATQKHGAVIDMDPAICPVEHLLSLELYQIDQELIPVVMKALETLNEVEQKVIRLRIMEQRPAKEVAQELNFCLGYCYRLIRKAYKNLCLAVWEILKQNPELYKRVLAVWPKAS